MAKSTGVPIGASTAKRVKPEVLTLNRAIAEAPAKWPHKAINQKGKAKEWEPKAVDMPLDVLEEMRLS